jgi:hypothetical protein
MTRLTAINQTMGDNAMYDDFIDVDLMWEDRWSELEPYIANDENEDYLEDYDPKEDEIITELLEYLLENQPW